MRPILDDNGGETGMFEVPAGGRRFRALELLVKQKRLARTAPHSVRGADRLAPPRRTASRKTIQRAPLHPLRPVPGVSHPARERQVAKRRSRRRSSSRSRWAPAAAAPRRGVARMLDVYAEDGMSLDQLMSFTVNPDHVRQQGDLKDPQAMGLTGRANRILWLGHRGRQVA